MRGRELQASRDFGHFNLSTVLENPLESQLALSAAQQAGLNEVQKHLPAQNVCDSMVMRYNDIVHTEQKIISSLKKSPFACDFAGRQPPDPQLPPAANSVSQNIDKKNSLKDDFGLMPARTQDENITLIDQGDAGSRGELPFPH